MTALATLPNEELDIEVTAAARVHLYGRGLIRSPFLPIDIEVTPKGAAAAAYLQARSAFWNEVTEPSRFVEPGVPDWERPEVIAARIVMTVAEDAYRAEGGYICEDCGMLEKCVCPNV